MEKTDKTVTERKKCIWLTLAVTVSSYTQEKQELPCGKKPQLKPVLGVYSVSQGEKINLNYLKPENHQKLRILFVCWLIPNPFLTH